MHKLYIHICVCTYVYMYIAGAIHKRAQTNFKKYDDKCREEKKGMKAVDAVIGIYMYIYSKTYICEYVYILASVCISLSLSLSLSLCIYVYTYLYMLMCMHIQTNRYISMYTCIYVADVYICVYIYKHM